MSLSDFALTKSWRDADQFPTYEDQEAKVRDDMQILFDELSVGLNKLIAELRSLGANTESDPYTDSGAKGVGITAIDALPGAANVQDALAAIMAAFVSGTVTNNSVFTAAIQDGAVTNPKLAADAVENANIKDGAVTWEKIAAGAVTNSKTDFSAGLGISGTLTQNGQLILKSGVTYGNSTTGQTPTAGRIFFKKVQ